jgi:asparagine synthase (glutamine-hydrolysing)
MCGITGKFNYQQENSVAPEILRAMCRTLTHRGPDDEGYYLDGNVGLAVRRLSIIDLNTGKQPIHNEDRTVWTVFNGEIYNFLELKRYLQARGHDFYTASDTEVIVHLYEEYGTDFPTHLSGMFAIVIWDRRERRLMLVRDRLGIKPLYYVQLSDRLLWGSEIKAILAEGLQPTLDYQALSHYLSLLYIPAPFSIYREIRKLEPGEAFIWQGGRAVKRSYWDLARLAVPGAVPRSREDVKEELLGLLTETVCSHLISDVPLGVFLSGGLDSSTVVALMRQVNHGIIKTFSVGFQDASYDELAFARIVAKKFETDHTELQVTPDAADFLPKLVDHFDEPFADSSAIPTYYLSQLTRRHVTVALGGDGGDEIFAGYATYQADKLARIYSALPGFLNRGLIPMLVRSLPVSDSKVSFDFKARRFVEHALLEPERRHYAWKAFFSDELKRRLLHEDIVAALHGNLDSFAVFSRHTKVVRHWDALNRFQYADLKVYLPDDILVKVDRMSMAHSLEARVPLLDHRLVEFLFQLTEPLKMPGLRLKQLLKETMRSILPKEILNKPKGGFSVPMAGWLKSSLKPLLVDYLAQERLRRQKCFNPEMVNRLITDHLAGRADYSRNLWALLNFTIWQQNFAEAVRSKSQSVS